GRQFCYQTTWPNLWWSNPLAYLEVVYMCRLMDNMSKEIPLDKPWKAPRAKEWDKLTVQDFLCRHCWTKDGVEFLLALCSNNNTADGYEMSLLYYLWYMCQGGGLLNLWRVKGGAQERKIIGGSQQVCLKMAEQLTERVHLNQPVVKINYSTKGVCVQTLDGTEFTGTHLILALPPSLQQQLNTLLAARQTWNSEPVYSIIVWRVPHVDTAMGRAPPSLKCITFSVSNHRWCIYHVAGIICHVSVSFSVKADLNFMVFQERIVLNPTLPTLNKLVFRSRLPER
ncbi:unnamed protein product, partial [Timema podura]|nr:unnamed protein product [Timema podura]